MLRVLNPDPRRSIPMVARGRSAQASGRRTGVLQSAVSLAVKDHLACSGFPGVRTKSSASRYSGVTLSVSDRHVNASDAPWSLGGSGLAFVRSVVRPD